MLGRLGLQKRIMLYVAMGLVLMFGAFSYIGVQAVHRATDLVFDQRLAMAQSVAAGLSEDFDHVRRDALEETGALGRGTDATVLEEATHRALVHLAGIDRFTFFIVDGVWLVDTRGEVLTSAPRDSGKARPVPLPATAAWASDAVCEPRVLWPEDGEGGQSACISVPLTDAQGTPWARLLISAKAIENWSVSLM